MVFQLFTGSHVRNPPYVQQQQQQIPQQAPINRRMGGNNLVFLGWASAAAS